MKVLTVAIIGCGSRGFCYGEPMAERADKYKIVSEREMEGYNRFITRTITLNRLIHSLMIIHKETQQPELLSKINNYKDKAQENIVEIIKKLN